MTARLGSRNFSPLVTELHANVCALIGALLLAGDAATLARSDGPWPVFAPMLAAGALLGFAAAIVPWVLPQVRLGVRRACIWGGWLIATAGAVCALVPLDYEALLGAQLLLLAAVLPEMSGRPASLRWFWASLILAVAIMLMYRELADLRPVAD